MLTGINPMTTRTEITTLSGKVQQPGHAALAKVFRALPDGDYTVTIAPAGSAIPEIEQVVGWFSELDDLQLNDPGLAVFLGPKAARLCDLLAKFGQEVNALRAERDGAKFRLETEIDRLLNADRLAAVASGTKWVQATSKTAAAVACNALLREKVEAEIAYNAGLSLLNGWERIYERMRSQISFLKDQR